MQIVQAPRASAILYNLLVHQQERSLWLLPANICPVVPITFFKAGIPFELVDISAKTLHMDLEQAEALIAKRRYGGLLYAHTYGEASTPTEAFRRIKNLNPQLLIIDDRCLCIPTTVADQENIADVQLYSTGYAKIVDLKFGGYAFMRDELVYQPRHLPYDQAANAQMEDEYKEAIRARHLFEYHDRNWLQTEAGLPAWQPYVEQIEAELKNSLDHRKQLNAIYAEKLPREIQLEEPYQVWRFNLLVKDKEQLLAAIFKQGLFASSHYASLAGIMSTDPCLQAESLHARVINLFNDRHFDESRAEAICDTILQYLT